MTSESQKTYYKHMGKHIVNIFMILQTYCKHIVNILKIYCKHNLL